MWCHHIYKHIPISFHVITTWNQGFIYHEYTCSGEKNILLWGKYHLRFHCSVMMGMVHRDSAGDKRNILS